MDPEQMDRDYRRARREEEQRLAIQAMLDLMVGRGELRTIFCRVQRRLIYFNPNRGCPTFPLERNSFRPARHGVDVERIHGDTGSSKFPLFVEDSHMPQLPRRVSEKLKYYVYLYVDPRDGEPFYVGKGAGNRVYSHLDDNEDNEKVQKIEELRKLGREPTLEILRFGLTEQEAFLVESAAIDLLRPKLTNCVKGHGAAENGRALLDEIIQELDAEDVAVTDKAILINISRLYRYGMTPMELYDATRGVWKVAPNRHDAKYAFCLYGGIVREVYEIATWVPAGSTMTQRDYAEKDYDLSERYEFVGRIAPEPIRRKYVRKSVRNYFVPGSQNPIKYVNC